MKNIINEVKAERKRQNEKWGEQNHRPIEWMGILTEEVGEASKEAVDYYLDTSPNHGKGFNPLMQKTRLYNYRKELIQVAAVAISMIESLERNELKD